MTYLDQYAESDGSLRDAYLAVRVLLSHMAGPRSLPVSTIQNPLRVRIASEERVCSKDQ